MRGVEGSTVLVTGSTDGIGKRTALGLASMGARVLLHGRNPAKGESAQREIEAATGARPEYYNADLSSLAEVRGLASGVARDRQALDVLINNAGIGTGPGGRGEREASADGYELRFAVNYLAPFLLTHLLLPQLRRAAPSRVVNVSSLGQSPLDFDDLMLERSYDPSRAYGQSKLALAMFSLELAERLEGHGITVNAVHPGSLLDTKMVREAYGHAWGTVQQGADAVIYLAASPEVEGVTGRFFDGKREARMRRQGYDAEARKRLYEVSARLTGLGPGALPAGPKAVSARA